MNARGQILPGQPHLTVEQEVRAIIQYHAALLALLHDGVQSLLILFHLLGPD
jgi:hypothetical protein